MKLDNALLDAYKRTKHQVVGHGPRSVQVLKDVLETIDGQTESDIYGKGKLIQDFQDKIAKYLGKEAAVFFPSGTMAQQIALRIWCDQRGLHRVAYHPLCHLEIHEENGLKALHNIHAVLLADETRVIELDDVLSMQDNITCLLLELPQREIGGQLPDYQTLTSISEYCRANGIKLHLDGARLFEILPYYKTTAADICQLFDSVYVSFYKSIGAVAGAILAGDKHFIEQSIIWKRRHGGDLISLYPYVSSADYYFDKRVDKMDKYYREAQELAGFFNRCPAVSTLPEVPVSNMFHVYFQLAKDNVVPTLIDMYTTTGIGFTGHLREVSDDQCYFEVNIGDQYESIPKDTLRSAFELLSNALQSFTRDALN